MHTTNNLLFTHTHYQTGSQISTHSHFLWHVGVPLPYFLNLPNIAFPSSLFSEFVILSILSLVPLPNELIADFSSVLCLLLSVKRYPFLVLEPKECIFNRLYEKRLTSSFFGKLFGNRNLNEFSSGVSILLKSHIR